MSARLLVGWTARVGEIEGRQPLDYEPTLHYPTLRNRPIRRSYRCMRQTTLPYLHYCAIGGSSAACGRLPPSGSRHSSARHSARPCHPRRRSVSASLAQSAALNSPRLMRQSRRTSVPTSAGVSPLQFRSNSSPLNPSNSPRRTRGRRRNWTSCQNRGSLLVARGGSRARPRTTVLGGKR